MVGCAQVEDKFGDNGITGVFIVDKENKKEWLIDTFLLVAESWEERSKKVFWVIF